MTFDTFFRRSRSAGNMIKFTTFLGLALMASGVLAAYVPDLKVTFGVSLISGDTNFIAKPITLAEAVSQGYVNYERPTSDRPELTMWCLPTDLTICLMYDDNGNLGAIQIAINITATSDPAFDWATQGYVSWNITEDDVTTYYQACYQYLMSEEYLALTSEERLAAYNSSTLYQGGMVSVSHFNGTLLDIPTDLQSIYDLGFTEQNCVVWMGKHSYWNMSSTTECTADTIAINFPLTDIDSGELIGMGMNVFAKYTNPSGKKDYFEYPAGLAVRYIVNNGPECLYALADSSILFTLHVYYVHTPRYIGC